MEMSITWTTTNNWTMNTVISTDKLSGSPVRTSKLKYLGHLIRRNTRITTTINTRRDDRRRKIPEPIKKYLDNGPENSTGSKYYQLTNKRSGSICMKHQ